MRQVLVKASSGVAPIMGDVAMSLGSVEHCRNEPDEAFGRGWSALCR
jgi:hypothetical protein